MSEPAVTLAPFAKPGKDGLMGLTLAVDGVHCAGCIRRIETAMQEEPAIREARLNFSTRRLTLRWQGGAEQADSYGKKIIDLGYKVQPFETAAAAGASEETRALLLYMAVAGFASGNIMLLAFALWTTSAADMGEATRAFLHWIAALIALPTAIYSGQPFYKSAWAALKKGRTNMDVPISVGVILTCVISVFELLNHAEHTYFDAVVMLLFFLLIGRYLDQRARSSARAAATDLLALMSGTATVLEAGQQKKLSIRDLQPGMIVQLAVGERVPADGEVLAATSMDSSLVTGETLPVTVSAGGPVHSGMVNVGVPVTVRVSKLADDSLLADIVRLMEKAEQGQAKYVRIADRAARLYTPVVHVLALATFLAWVFIGNMPWDRATVIAATVLIITCPCALGLAVPVVQVLATSILMKRGIMVKAGDAFERLAVIDTLLFDKTGTLTRGQPELLNVPSYPAERLKQAAAMAAQSRHPLAQALLRACPGPHEAVTVTEHPGQGLSAGESKLGSRSFIGASGADDSQLELWLSQPSQPPLRFTFADQLRADAKEVLTQLKAQGIAVQMLSGDRPEVVASVAAELGITGAQGGLKPADKVAQLEALRAQGHKIGMVGDGLNDAPVLSAADVSLSPASALDITQNAADIVFTGEKLAPVLRSLQIARFSQKLVRENFFLSIFYNIFFIPLAMAGYVTPMIAAIAMSGSSLAVIANSFRLKRLG
jgi:Cu2+-exporting ATPase